MSKMPYAVQLAMQMRDDGIIGTLDQYKFVALRDVIIAQWEELERMRASEHAVAQWHGKLTEMIAECSQLRAALAEACAIAAPLAAIHELQTGPRRTRIAELQEFVTTADSETHAVFKSDFEKVAAENVLLKNRLETACILAHVLADRFTKAWQAVVAVDPKLEALTVGQSTHHFIDGLKSL